MTKHTYEAMYIIRISDNRSLIRAASKMDPFASKKAAEPRMVLDYVNDGINGSQAIAILNQMRSEGLRIAAKRAHEGARMKLPKLSV